MIQELGHVLVVVLFVVLTTVALHLSTIVRWWGRPGPGGFVLGPTPHLDVRLVDTHAYNWLSGDLDPAISDLVHGRSSDVIMPPQHWRCQLWRAAGMVRQSGDDPLHVVWVS